MSFNRLMYDNCAYQHQLSESVGTLSYVLDPNRFENCNKCRMELGIVGGTGVSHIKGNLVDLESDLRNQTRLQSKCPSMKYLNPCPNGDMNTCQPSQIVIKGTPTMQGRVIDTGKQHLNSCQMFRYKQIPLPPPIESSGCRLFSNFQ
jgi:hypothetical protein